MWAAFVTKSIPITFNPLTATLHPHLQDYFRKNCHSAHLSNSHVRRNSILMSGWLAGWQQTENNRHNNIIIIIITLNAINQIKWRYPGSSSVAGHKESSTAAGLGRLWNWMFHGTRRCHSTTIPRFLPITHLLTSQVIPNYSLFPPSQSVF